MTGDPSSTNFTDDIRAAFRRGDNAGVLRMATAEIERARRAGDPAGEVESLYALARVALRGDELGEAERLAQAALSVATLAADRRLEERPRHVLAAIARMSGDYAKASELYQASIELNEALGNSHTVTSEYHNLAFTELRLGHVDRARKLFEVSRERVFREGLQSFEPYVCVGAAALASAEGDYPLAARMVGLSDAAFAVVGQVPDPDDSQELSAVRAAAVAALGEAGFARQYATGTTQRPAEAFGFPTV